MIKLKEFAEKYNVSETTVRKYLNIHSHNLEGHYESKGNKGTWLDDTAVAYLAGVIPHNVAAKTVATKETVAKIKPPHPSVSTTACAENNLKRECERLREENDILLRKNAELSEKLIDALEKKVKKEESYEKMKNLFTPVGESIDSNDPFGSNDDIIADNNTPLSIWEEGVGGDISEASICGEDLDVDPFIPDSEHSSEISNAHIGNDIHKAETKPAFKEEKRSRKPNFGCEIADSAQKELDMQSILSKGAAIVFKSAVVGTKLALRTSKSIVKICAPLIKSATKKDHK